MVSQEPGVGELVEAGRLAAAAPLLLLALTREDFEAILKMSPEVEMRTRQVHALEGVTECCLLGAASEPLFVSLVQAAPIDEDAAFQFVTG